MSDELKYWHETDDPHRIEAAPLASDYGNEWEPKLYESPMIWYGPGGRIRHFPLHIEPDVIKTRDGGTKLVGLSFVPGITYPRSLAELAQSKQLSIASLGGAGPLTQEQIDRMRQQMERDFVSTIHKVMLSGEPMHDDTITIDGTTYTFKKGTQPTRRSLFTRFKLWVRRQYWRVRDLFVRDDEDYDE